MMLKPGKLRVLKPSDPDPWPDAVQADADADDVDAEENANDIVVGRRPKVKRLTRTQAALRRAIEKISK